MLAAGLVVVAHDSGGPKLDIVCPTLLEDPQRGVGLLARDEKGYAAAMRHALVGLGPGELGQVAARAVAQSRRFSDAKFAEAVVDLAVRERGLFTARSE